MRHGVWIGMMAALLVTFCAAQAEEPPLLEEVLQGPLADVDEIVFAKRVFGPDPHWYANFSYFVQGPQRVTYIEGGKLEKLNLRTGELNTILDDPKGSIRDPQVYYDGTKILFSYRPGGTEFFHLYEINTDGSGLRQLTDGGYDDIEPTYLPDGDILFVSSRCKRWVNCWLTQVAVMYRCGPDGGNIRPVSSNTEHDNTPWPLPDGRILYQRWEYVDRSQVHYHHLWTMNPDGTGQMVYYGNQTPGILMIDAKPIPGTDKVVSIFSPGHGRKEHSGKVVVVDPKLGPDAPEGAVQIHSADDMRDPWPFSDKLFMVAQGSRLLLLDDQGRFQSIYRVDGEDRDRGMAVHEPRPIQARPREAKTPVRTKPESATGRLILSNVYEGRNMDGVEPGAIKKLLVLESLPKPINYTGGMEPISLGGTFTLERVLGTVPVEPDGSAYIEAPALRSLILVALDERDLAVKRMQSFLTVQPGETQSCVGCHEQRTLTTLPTDRLEAMNRAPSVIEPVADVPDVFDFPRDIQPILDRYCVSCHGYEATEAGGPMDGGVILTGDRGPVYSHSYVTLTVTGQFKDGRNLAVSNYAPYTFGSAASPLLAKLQGDHYDIHATEHELKVARLWIETGAPYPGTYAALGSGMIGGHTENEMDQSSLEWPGVKAAREAIGRRCTGCHKENAKVATAPTQNAPHFRKGRHIAYNLSRPERSLQLLAPLAAESGGFGTCKNQDGTPVFANTDDADYQTMLSAIVEAKNHLDAITRFDMPDFRPRPEYVREMKRYGILPADLAEDAKVDPYATDRAYWESLWWKPQPAAPRLARR